MRLIKQQLSIYLALGCLILAGCSTTPSSVSQKKPTEKPPAPTPVAVEVDRIDMSTLAPVTDSSPKEEIFHYAIALMTNGRYQEAETKLLTLTHKHPELAGPFTNLGISYFHSDQFDKAIDAFNQSLTLKPANPVAYDYLARIHRDSGKFDIAQEHYLKAIEADANYAPAQRNLGILYDLYLGKPIEAIKHYQRYLALIDKTDRQVSIWVKDLTNRTKALQSAKESN